MQKPENYIGHHTPETERQYHDRRGEHLEVADFIPEEDTDFLQMARDAFETSDDYFDSNIRKQQEKNLHNFQSKHPSGSKYRKPSYKYRSKVFRPKLRAMARRTEAQAALAFFGTTDVVNCAAEDLTNQNSLEGARIASNLLNYRLEYSIPWFLTVIGAVQDAYKQGVILSRQEWRFETEEEDDPQIEIDPFGDASLNEQNTKTIVKEDKPDIVLMPIENLRFSPAADWRDPIGTSPYLIELIPMYAIDIMERMEEAPRKGMQRWFEYTIGNIQSASRTGDSDSIRHARENDREDSTDERHHNALYDIYWVHRNIFKIEGEDYVYYTLGTELLLSEPVLLTEEFRHGRPYKLGYMNVETHKNYPASMVELGEGSQAELNDLVNLRLDNIKLSLNVRHHARRNANVDWRALANSVPSGIVLMDKLDDVQAVKIPDVTGSSFQEQDRIDNNFDELMGSFSVSSVRSQRSLNETVGGMNMAADDSNVVSEYQLRVIVETWVEPVLRQVLEMERLYETDEWILRLVGNGRPAEEVDALIKENINVRVNVGFGSTSPQKRVERLSTGMEIIGKFMPHMLQRLDEDEINKEIFGAMGFRDGSRFFKNEEDQDPRLQEMQNQVMKLQQLLEGKQLEQQTKLQVAEIKEQGQNQRFEIKMRFDYEMKTIDNRLRYIGEQIKAETNDISRGKLILEQEALEFQKATALMNIKQQELQSLTDESNQLSEILMNDRYGVMPNAEDFRDGEKKPYKDDQGVR